MNKGLAAIIITLAAGSILWVFRLAAVDHYVKNATQVVNNTFDTLRQKQEDRARDARALREAEKAAAVEARRRELEADCYILTSHGRKLTCADPK